MKEKEEDEERNENICRHTIKQILNSKTEAHSNPLWIVGERANYKSNIFEIILIQAGIALRRWVYIATLI